MDISKLTIGMTFKNYKELCLFLDMPVKAGKSKILQLEDLSRYCVFTRDKQKYIVTEIFIEPLAKMEYVNGNNSKYVEHIKYMLLHKLSTCDGYTCTFTKNNLFEFLGMVNPFYSKKAFIKKIIQTNNSDISDFDINHFYMRSNDRMTRILFDSLNSLKRQFLISYREVDMIVRLNEKGIKEHNEANKEEIKLIMDIKRQVLLDMKLTSMMQIIFKFKTEEFYRRVTGILKEEYDIEYTYKQFELIFTKENILEEIEILESKEHKIELNDKVCDVVNKNAYSTYKKNIEKYERELEEYLLSDELAIGNFNETGFSGFRLKFEYLDFQLELTEYLLRLDK